MKKVDYIIVGCGIAGATLALQLRNRGKSVVVFNHDGGASASRVAAGIFNPITGKLLMKTWMADKLFPALHHWYHGVEKKAGVTFMHALPIYIPFRSVEEQNDWIIKSSSIEFQHFIKEVYTTSHFSSVHDSLGGMMLRQSGYIDVNLYLDSIKEMLLIEGNYVNQAFDHEIIQSTPEKVTYQDWEAGAVIFCQGVSQNNNHPFHWIPLRPLHGETIEVERTEKDNCILNRGVYIVPVAGNKSRVGATYRHGGEPGPTTAGKLELTEKLGELIRDEFKVVDQNWGSRPTSPDRRPILGRHPDNEKLWIFNGLGTKGISLAPYFSNVLAEAILGTGEVPLEVNITRFYPLYSKSRD